MIKNVKVTHHSAWQGKLYTNQNIPIRGHKGASTGILLEYKHTVPWRYDKVTGYPS